MSERRIDGGNFVPTSHQGDPGKLEYLHNPGWTGKVFSQVRAVDPRACLGCYFKDAKPGKWPHNCGKVAGC